jgi:hypothetical protein
MSKLVKFALVSLTSGEIDLGGYVDSSEVVSFNVWNIGDELPPGGGIHRKMRGKSLVSLNLRGGIAHWTDETFDDVAAKLLEARGQSAEAKTHKDLADGAKIQKSRLAI